VALCRLFPSPFGDSGRWPIGGRVLAQLIGKSGGVSAASLLNGGGGAKVGGLNKTPSWSDGPVGERAPSCVLEILRGWEGS
jgi:hypothetical protein